MYFFDENEFNADRQHASWPVTPLPTPTGWNGFIDSLKKDVIRGWKGTLEFHAGLRNCTTRIWKKMRVYFGKERVPDIRINFWQMKPSGY